MMSGEVPHHTMTSYSPTSSPLIQRSPWHSPVPYLFGGLAAMLGLIAFALLILACSYWKLSGYLENDGENQENNRDLELGDADSSEKQKVPPVYEDKILVIMAGQAVPTVLATPATIRASSFGSKFSSSSGNSGEEQEEKEKVKDNQKQINCDEVPSKTEHKQFRVESESLI